MTTIVLADDHPVVRHALRQLLEEADDFRVVGEASDGLEAVRLIQRAKPDIAILDMMMPGLNGLEIIRELRKHSPRTRVIVLSMHDTETYVLEALRAGAMGYVLKQSPPEEIVRAVLEVSAGRHFLTPSLQNIVIQAFKTQPLGMSSDAYDQLSPRERQVLSLTGEGLSREQIAKRLGIGVTTVATYRANLLRKLGLRTPADLIRYALERGGAKKRKRTK